MEWPWTAAVKILEKFLELIDTPERSKCMRKIIAKRIQLKVEMVQDKKHDDFRKGRLDVGVNRDMEKWDLREKDMEFFRLGLRGWNWRLPYPKKSN